jgi:hypothetical protein
MLYIMEMINGLKSLMLAGMVSAISYTQAQDKADPIASPDTLSAQTTKSTALMLLSDMTHGSEARYIDVWAKEVYTVQNFLQKQNYSYLTLGTGYTTAPVETQMHRIDSTLQVMSKNKQDDFIYMVGHGGLDSTDTHNMTLGHELLGLSDNNQYALRNVITPTTTLVSKLVRNGYEENKNMTLVLVSCGGDKIIQEILQRQDGTPQTEIPPGTTIETFSQAQDVTFSSTYGSAVEKYERDYPTGYDPLKIHHLYNNYIYNDESNSHKYVHAPSGSTLLRVKENGETIVLCPRKSIYDRMGKGLSAEDKAVIADNHKRHVYPYGRMLPDLEKGVSHMLSYVSDLLQVHTDFTTVPRDKQMKMFEWMTYLEEEIAPRDYLSFVEQEKQQRKAKAMAQPASSSKGP